ncbi:MAG TPA: hypothetical protein VGD54_19670 [Steroidobacteraceae bacterium]
MTAESIVYDYDLDDSLDDPIDETERLFAALDRYTNAELIELLYTAEEPGFFQFMRGVFALSEESRSILHNFLTTVNARTTTASIDPEGRCILIPGPVESPRIAVEEIEH